MKVRLDKRALQLRKVAERCPNPNRQYIELDGVDAMVSDGFLLVRVETEGEESPDGPHLLPVGEAAKLERGINLTARGIREGRDKAEVALEALEAGEVVVGAELAGMDALYGVSADLEFSMDFRLLDKAATVLFTGEPNDRAKRLKVKVFKHPTLAGYMLQLEAFGKPDAIAYLAGVLNE